MDQADFTRTVQVTWLVLCGMMLFSRFVFQAAGPVWMRTFLDGWKVSVTHRAWGILALIYGVGIASCALGVWSSLRWIDVAVLVPLIAVLCADGLLNLLPSWFGHFKERMQDSWVKRHGQTGRASDEHLFGTVNFALGMASFAVAAAVYRYRLLSGRWLLASVVIATAIMVILIAASRIEAGRAAREAS